MGGGCGQQQRDTLHRTILIAEKTIKKKKKPSNQFFNFKEQLQLEWCQPRRRRLDRTIALSMEAFKV